MANPVILGMITLGGITIAMLTRVASSGSSTTTIAQIPAIVERLRRRGTAESFVVFRFSPRGGAFSDQNTAELQFSKEGGRVGLDWVLRAPRNIADQARVAELARSLGHTMHHAEMNDVRYLRVEDGDIAALGMRIAKDFYGLHDGSKVDLIAEDDG
jgi:hypothetical protein